jgi:multidrug efflux pump subunit AcrB
MDQLARFTIENSRFTVLVLLALLIGGLFTYSSQPRQEDPEIVLRGAQVTAQFPGMSPERVEQLITKPIEEAIKQIPEIDDIKSVSMTGVAIITPEAGAQYSDMEPIWADLRNKMTDLAARLPEGTSGPFVNDDFGRVAVVTL